MNKFGRGGSRADPTRPRGSRRRPSARSYEVIYAATAHEAFTGAPVIALDSLDGAHFFLSLAVARLRLGGGRNRMSSSLAHIRRVARYLHRQRIGWHRRMPLRRHTLRRDAIGRLACAVGLRVQSACRGTRAGRRRLD